MFQSLRNFYVYQSSTAKCLSDNDGLRMTKGKDENRVITMAKRRAAIIKRNAALQDKMNELIKRSQDLLQY
jgi:hypothetical protein